MKELPQDEKRSVSHLSNLPENHKNTIARLVLIQGSFNHYDAYALKEYMRQLKALEYFEIQGGNGKFVGLLPVKLFKKGRQTLVDRLDRFIYSLENSRVVEDYCSEVITTSIQGDSDLIDSLKIMRRKRVEELVILDEEGNVLGLLLALDVEKKIVDSVLDAKEIAQQKASGDAAKRRA